MRMQGYTICRGAKLVRMGRTRPPTEREAAPRGRHPYGQLGEVQPTTAAVPTGAPRVWGQGQRE